MRAAVNNPSRATCLPSHLLLLIAFAGLAAQGCGGEDWQAATHPAWGHLSINGEPASGAVVTLHPLGDQVDVRQSTPWGIVKEDGTYVLTTYERGDGAPPGEYALTVKWPPDVTSLSGAMTDRLGGAYATAEKSQWNVSITEGANTLPFIDIEDAHVAPIEKAQPPRGAPPGPRMKNTN